MKKYTIVDYFGYDISPIDRMKAIKQSGFDGVVLLWANYFDEDYDRFPGYAEKAGIFVENLHAPYRGANSLWYDNLRGQEYTDSILRTIDDAAAHGIDTVVMHFIVGGRFLVLAVHSRLYSYSASFNTLSCKSIDNTHKA